MAADKKLFYMLLIFLIAICVKSDEVETREEVVGSENYVPRPDMDSISNIFKLFINFSFNFNFPFFHQ